MAKPQEVTRSPRAKDVPALMRLLSREVGDTAPAIAYGDPFKVLVATVLSARSRDAQTVKVADALFARYPDARALARAPLPALQKVLKPIGFYRAKSKNVKKLAQALVREHGGRVPDTREELVALSGVGRKTANCVLAYAFSKPAIAVDVHVHRITNRWGLVSTKKPEDTERELERLVPKRYWLKINEWLVKFGQKKCFPRNPNCPACALRAHCDHYRDAYIPAHR